MKDLHSIASDYLRKIERHGYAYKPAEVVEQTAVTGFVTLRRAENPPYFYGFKPSGIPVFTHDIRLAKSFHAQHPALDEHVSRLTLIGHEIDLHPTVWNEGRNIHE